MSIDPEFQSVNRGGADIVAELTDFFYGLMRDASRMREADHTEGEIYLVHSALSAFGAPGRLLPGGATTVTKALVAAADRRGATLVMCAHRGDEIGSGMGAIADRFRRWPLTRVSAHPTLAFAARGRRARELLAGHRPSDALGPLSPAGRLVDSGAIVLLLGTGWDTCTLMHLAEYARSPDRVTCSALVGWGPFARLATWTDVRYDAAAFPAIGAAFEAENPERVLSGDLPFGKGRWRACSSRDIVGFSIDRYPVLR
jgi:aminoglycoside N3'-acetyltransferase